MGIEEQERYARVGSEDKNNRYTLLLSYLTDWSKERIDGNVVRFAGNTVHGSSAIREH